jgi:hypothetical protein
MEQIEHFEFYRKCLVDGLDKVKYWKLIGGRLVGTLLIMSLTFLSDNLVKILDLCGSLIMPLMGFVIPIIIVNIKYWGIDKKRPSAGRILHD